MERKTLHLAEVAEALGVNKCTVRGFVRSGILPAVKIGRRWFVPVAAFEELLSRANGNKNEEGEKR